MTGRAGRASPAVWLTAAAWLLAAPAAEIQVVPGMADGRVTASFAVPSSFSDEDQAVIKSGLQLTFTFIVELRKPSALWIDHTLCTVSVASSVKFDNLTGTYQVSKSQDNRVTWSDRTDDGAQVREWMTTFDRIPLVAEEQLQPKGEYYVQVRMQTSPKRTFCVWPFCGDDGSGRATLTSGE